MISSNFALDSILGELSKLIRQQSAHSLMELGLGGHQFVTDNAFSGKVFCKLVAWNGADAQVDYTVTALDGTTTSHSNVTLQDGGAPIVGKITGLSVDSGAVCAYYYLSID